MCADRLRTVRQVQLALRIRFLKCDLAYVFHPAFILPAVALSFKCSLLSALKALISTQFCCRNVLYCFKLNEVSSTRSLKCPL